MPNITHAIEYLQERADRLAAQIAERQEYKRATGLTPLLTDRLAAEHASLAAALEILRAEEAGGERLCRGDCMLCDAPTEPPELAAARAKVREAGDDLRWALDWQARRGYELAVVDDARKELAAAEAALEKLQTRDTYLPDG